jgi:hypothetical protein
VRPAPALAQVVEKQRFTLGDCASRNHAKYPENVGTINATKKVGTGNALKKFTKRKKIPCVSLRLGLCLKHEK